MAVLVTGGTGFLGAALLPRLARRGEVIALHRPGSRPREVTGVTWVEQDLSAPLGDGLPERLDAVVHVAQSRRYREFPDGAVDVFEVNAAATVRLLDLCRRAGGSTFVYASSGSVYAPGPDPVREQDEPRPGNFYAVSKLAGEQAAGQFRGLLNVHLLRFFFIYGPGQERMFIPGIVERVRSGTPVTLAGDDGIRVNPVYVDDAAAAVDATLDLEESVTLNVAGPDVVSLRDIARHAGAAVGVEPSFENGPAGEDLVASIERLNGVAAPEIGMAEGLRRTVAGG